MDLQTYGTEPKSLYKCIYIFVNPHSTLLLNNNLNKLLQIIIVTPLQIGYKYRYSEVYIQG